MNVLVIADPEKHKSFISYLSEQSLLNVITIKSYPTTRFEGIVPEVVFDFMFGNEGSELLYNNIKPKYLFLDTSSTGLLNFGLSYPDWKGEIIGFNGLPTCFKAPLMEVIYPEKTINASEFLHSIGLEGVNVANRTGLVMPRIISMIINEAWFTYQEGTASKQDIDTSMKLGTNYPYGPFEWTEKIGAEKVVSVLEGVYNETRDERYKVCPLLKLESIKNIIEIQAIKA